MLSRPLDNIIPLRVRNRIRLFLKRHPYEYRSRWPDLAMLTLRHKDVVIDVGANVGDFTECVLAYQPGAVVHAFEPLPEPFKVLAGKFPSDPAIHCRNLALGSERSVKSLNVSAYNQASSFLSNGALLKTGVYGIDFSVTGTIDVPVDTLSNYVIEHRIERIKLLKLDVQGYELEVLKGAEPILRLIDYVYTEAQFEELYQRGPLFTDIFEFLCARDHELLRMTAFRSDDAGRLMECDMIFRNRRSSGT